MAQLQLLIKSVLKLVIFRWDLRKNTRSKVLIIQEGMKGKN
jgi:hypothetical protein